MRAGAMPSQRGRGYLCNQHLPAGVPAKSCGRQGRSGAGEWELQAGGCRWAHRGSFCCELEDWWGAGRAEGSRARQAGRGGFSTVDARAAATSQQTRVLICHVGQSHCSRRGTQRFAAPLCSAPWQAVVKATSDWTRAGVKVLIDEPPESDVPPGWRLFFSQSLQDVYDLACNGSFNPDSCVLPLQAQVRPAT